MKKLIKTTSIHTVERIIPTMAYSLPAICLSLVSICTSDFAPNASPNIQDTAHEKTTIINGLRWVDKSYNVSIHITPDEKGPRAPNTSDPTASPEILGSWHCAPAYVWLKVSSFSISFFLIVFRALPVVKYLPRNLVNFIKQTTQVQSP